MLPITNKYKITTVNAIIAIALLLLALLVGVTMASKFFVIPLFFVAALSSIMVFIVCLVNPLLGFYITIVAAFLAYYPSRLLNINLPISTGVEVLMLFVFVGSLRQQKKIDLSYKELWKAPITIGLFCYALFFIVELLNPEMDSIAGWILYARRVALFILIYVLAYRLLDTSKKIRYFFKFWIIAAFIVALYGFYQQMFGMFSFELRELMSDPHKYRLFMQGGFIRKSSILSDPVSFGVLCGVSASFLIPFIIATKKILKKLLLLSIFTFLIMGVLFSGTRTTLIMVPAAVALYSIMTINHKATVRFVFVFFTVIAFLLLAPIYNIPALNRMRSVVQPQEASLDVRDMNRHYIQPYIYKHPFGGGVATSGVDGVRFNMGHPLAGFPPDSGLLKYAVETGWIGFIIIMILYFVMLAQGINYYFRARDKKVKLFILAITISLFSNIVTEYSQVTIGQIPGTFFFYASLALLKRLLEQDETQIATN